MATLSDAVIARIGDQRLVELTNEGGTATTIDTGVLSAACEDASGDFERITGLSADISRRERLAILVQGVIYYLEDYKSRESGITNARGQRFYRSCDKLREKVTAAPVTNSPLEPSSQRDGARPDMDRSKTVWKYGSVVSSPGESLEEGDL